MLGQSLVELRLLLLLLLLLLTQMLPEQTQKQPGSHEQTLATAMGRRHSAQGIALRSCQLLLATEEAGELGELGLAGACLLNAAKALKPRLGRAK